MKSVLLITVATLALGVSCEPVPPTNPYDPATPLDDQARSRIVGRVVLPTRDLEASRVELLVIDAEGRVYEEDGVTKVFETRVLDEGLPAGFDDDGEAPGTFDISVPPGSWTLLFDAARNGEPLYLDALERGLDLSPGAQVQVVLKPARLSADELLGVVTGQITGAQPGRAFVVRLEPLQSELGIAPRAVTLTASGSYTFSEVVPDTEYRVKVEGEAYAPAASPVFSVAPTNDATNPFEVDELRLTTVGALFAVDFAALQTTAPYVDTTDVPVMLLLDQIFLPDPAGGGLHHLEARALSTPAFDALVAAEEQGTSTDGLWVELAETTAPLTVDLTAGLDAAPVDGAHTIEAQLRVCFQSACDCAQDDDTCTPPIASAASTLAVVLDRAAPAVQIYAIGAGSGFVTTADGSASASVGCVDATAAQDELTMTIVDQVPAALYTGRRIDIAPIALGATEGPRAITASCTDPAGNVGTSAAANVIVDHTAPSITSFVATAVGGGTRTRSPVLAATWTLADPVAGGAIAAVAEQPFHCGTARYDYAATETARAIPITAGDGARSLYLCTRDAAGNTTTSSTPSTTAVTLDTDGPDAPALLRTAITTTSVSLAWTIPADADLAGFALERRLDGEGTFTVVAPALGPAIATYVDAVAATDLGTHRTYRVRAYDDLTNSSAYSIELDTGAPFAPVTGVLRQSTASPAKRQLLWTLPPGTALELPTYRYEDKDGNQLETQLAAGATSFVLSTDPQIANERLVLRTQNNDLSLVWETEFAFGSTRRTLDGDPNVGTHTGIAIDAQGIAHVSYQEFGNPKALRYLKLDGVSEPVIVDATSGAGWFTSIAIGPDDIAHIAYWNENTTDLYVVAMDSTPVPQRFTTANDDGRNPSIAVDAAGNVHVTSYDFTGKHLFYKKIDGITPDVDLGAVANGGYNELALDADSVAHIAWFDDALNQIAYQKMDGVATRADLGAVAGTSEGGVSLAIDEQGVAHVAWNDAITGDLLYRKVDGVATTTMVDAAGDTGAYPSLAVDAAGVVHIAYYDFDERDLRYVALDGTPEPVTLDSVGQTGRYTDLAVGKDGDVHISYFNGALVYFMLDRDLPPRIVDGATTDVGDYSSIAVDEDGVPYIAYYDFTNRDLKLAVLDGETTPFALDTATDVGLYTSITIDSAGIPHVAYKLSTGSDLRYLKADGVAVPITVDTTGPTGNWNSLALDSADDAHIVYFNDGQDEIRYVKVDGTTTPAPVILEDQALGLNGRPAIAIDDADVPHVVWYDWGLGLLRYVKVDGVSVPTTLDDDGDVGDFASIAKGPDGVLHIAYADITNGDLKYIKLDGANVPVVLDADGVVGQWTSIAIDTEGVPHISYRDVSRGSLKYLRSDGRSTPQIVDDSRLVGDLETSIALDADGVPHISYCDCNDGDAANDLKYVRGSFAQVLLALRVDQL